MTNKNPLFLLILLLTGATALAKDDTPTAQELIDAAHGASDLSKLGPYTMTGLVMLDPDGKHKPQGYVTIYRDGDRTRVDLELDGQKDSSLTLGDKRYSDPQRDLLAVVRVGHLDRSWDPGDASDVPVWIHPKSSFGAVKSSKSGAMPAWCVDKKTGTRKTRLCFDVLRGVLLSEETDAANQKKFLEFTSLGAVMFPRKIKLAVPGILPIEISQIQVTQQHFAADVFAIPKDTMEFETCDDMKPPERNPVDTQRLEEAWRLQTGAVGLDVIVTKEGKAGAVRVTNRAGRELDRIARDAVSAWTFKPASCAGHPVNFEMAVEVDFRTR